MLQFACVWSSHRHQSHCHQSHCHQSHRHQSLRHQSHPHQSHRHQSHCHQSHRHQSHRHQSHRHQSHCHQSQCSNGNVPCKLGSCWADGGGANPTIEGHLCPESTQGTRERETGRDLPPLIGRSPCESEEIVQQDASNLGRDGKGPEGLLVVSEGSLSGFTALCLSWIGIAGKPIEPGGTRFPEPSGTR
ncbi:hypothetical protein EYF80_037663 [Liparis tanakae]|uniref:Uncharacterized protein n=1 Tax=Liparis tanakae TaxID=230148 RepID=A0A4Z2GH89_9TELE|nr:hypothetical protein EYF80_037663 [Liparis tanakae]